MRRFVMAGCFLVAAVAAVLAAGCGGDDGKTGNTSPNTKQAEKEASKKK